jgi:hypothetical protein
MAVTSSTSSVRFLNRQAQAQRYSRHVRTIKRWGKDPAMNMPPEYDLKEPMRREDELEAWERSRVAVGDSDIE